MVPGSISLRIPTDMRASSETARDRDMVHTFGLMAAITRGRGWTIKCMETAYT